MLRLGTRVLIGILRLGVRFLVGMMIVSFDCDTFLMLASLDWLIDELKGLQQLSSTCIDANNATVEG